MRILFAPLVVLALALSTPAETPRPPEGFVALSDGRSLSGWHGMPHCDPYKLASLFCGHNDPVAFRLVQIRRLAR